MDVNQLNGLMPIMYVRIVQIHVVWGNVLNVRQIRFVKSVKLVINFKLRKILNIMNAWNHAMQIKYMT